MGCPRQESWSGLLFPPPGESSQPRVWTCVSCIAGKFTADNQGSPTLTHTHMYIYICKYICKLLIRWSHITTFPKLISNDIWIVLYTSKWFYIYACIHTNTNVSIYIYIFACKMSQITVNKTIKKYYLSSLYFIYIYHTCHFYTVIHINAITLSVMLFYVNALY